MVLRVRDSYLFATALGVLLCMAAGAELTAADWTQFRGPDGMGVASEPLPTQFGPQQNLRWKTKLPGAGASSPVILGDRIFLTSYTGYAVPGEADGSIDRLKRHVLCLDRVDGRLLWDRAIPAVQPEEADIRESHGYASSSPAVDAERVYVFFGKSGVFAFDHEGKQLWHADVGSRTNRWGSAASPVLHDDLVLINASVESDALYALNKRTGATVWRADGVREAWNTPNLVTTEAGATEIVVPIIEQVLAFDPTSGEQPWNCRTDIPWYMAPSAVARDGIVYCIGGRPGYSLAVRSGGRGDVTATHRLWAVKKGSNVPSPILRDNELYWMHDNLEYIQKDPIHRKYHHRNLTFGMMYHYSEKFILPFSHDEVVHLKKAMLAKMPGDLWQQFANLRLLYGYKAGFPGKKLDFMGGEFGQWNEWNHERELDWHLLRFDEHRQLRDWSAALNRLVRDEPALHQADYHCEGFEWVSCDEWEQSIVSFLRYPKDQQEALLFVANFTPVAYTAHPVGLPWGGKWTPVLSSDWEEFGGSGLGHRDPVTVEETPWNGRHWSTRLVVPPLGVVILRSKRPLLEVNKKVEDPQPVQS
ncbi:hypothetical protein DYH09_32490 [bacterium CPR1]|nr:hypothetical protein [bacterium CPR1]